MEMKPKNIVVFCLRHDDVSGLNEGEHYIIDEKTKSGIINTNQWASPSLSDHQVFICIGKRAIKDGFDRYNMWMEKNSKLKHSK